MMLLWWFLASQMIHQVWFWTFNSSLKQLRKPGDYNLQHEIEGLKITTNGSDHKQAFIRFMCKVLVNSQRKTTMLCTGDHTRSVITTKGMFYERAGMVNMKQPHLSALSDGWNQQITAVRAPWLLNQSRWRFTTNNNLILQTGNH